MNAMSCALQLPSLHLKCITNTSKSTFPSRGSANANIDRACLFLQSEKVNAKHCASAGIPKECLDEKKTSIFSTKKSGQIKGKEKRDGLLLIAYHSKSKRLSDLRMAFKFVTYRINIQARQKEGKENASNASIDHFIFSYYESTLLKSYSIISTASLFFT